MIGSDEILVTAFLLVGDEIKGNVESSSDSTYIKGGRHVIIICTPTSPDHGCQHSDLNVL